MVQPLDINSFSLTPPVWGSTKKTLPPRHSPGQRFLRGPIPLDWIATAGKLPGKALLVGIAAWHIAGMKKSAAVVLPNALLRTLGVSRHSAYRALKALEASSLVSVVRHRGRNPTVTLLAVPPVVEDVSNLLPGPTSQSPSCKGQADAET